MKWPVKTIEKTFFPKKGGVGGFLEQRGDRVHCGLDIYAEKGKEVVAMESGRILLVGIFTSKEMIHYWNTTYQVMAKGRSGVFYRYAELSDTLVEEGEHISEGQVIGHIGEVLNRNAIDETSPGYIQQLQKKKRCSMLHLEIYSSSPIDSNQYLGGNWFGDNIPNNLLNPADLLGKCSDAQEKQKP